MDDVVLCSVHFVLPERRALLLGECGELCDLAPNHDRFMGVYGRYV